MRLKISLLLILINISIYNVFGQCGGGGLVFASQQQIDDFLTNNPTCTEIIGDVYIGYCCAPTDITNLHGLSNINSISGYLIVTGNPLLTNVDGLASLTNIGGNLQFISNDLVTDLSGLNALQNVGSIAINNNNSLTNFDLSSLVSPGGGVQMSYNNSLTSFSINSALNVGFLLIDHNPSLNSFSLSGVTSVGTIQIEYNSALSTFNLGAVHDVESYIAVQYNPALTNFNLNSVVNVGSFMLILGNDSLLNCDLDSVQNINDFVQIEDNATLTQIDLSSLAVIFSYLKINNNDALADLNLNSLQNSGSVEIINNDTLENLNFNLLQDVDGNLTLSDNYSLANLNSLSALESINGWLTISNNYSLNDISGLVNISPASISVLSINDNTLLPVCNISNICTFLDSPKPRYILNNTGNCVDEPSVVAACSLAVRENDLMNVRLYPNPASDIITIQNPTHLIFDKIMIFDLTGKKLIEKTENTSQVKVENLAAGLYFFEAFSGNEKYMKIFLKN